MMNLDERQQLARRFLSVLGHPDAEVVRSVAVEDMIWTFPGNGTISGEAHGVAGVMKRATTIASYGVAVEIIRAVYSLHGVAMLLHNTGQKNGLVLDEHLAAVFTFRNDRICRLDTFLSDVPMMEAFFA